ncbi:MAG TPA: hypothetical protein GXX29_10600 [Firmicutes bacterium]|nr:hypothetical protein [Bacillota bacterium]
MSTTIVLLALLLYIPTSILCLYVGLRVIGYVPKAKPLLIFGALHGILLTIFHNTPRLFGLHIPLNTLTMILIIYYLARCRLGMAVLAGLVAVLLTAIGEGLFTAPLFLLMGVSLEESIKTFGYRMLGGWFGNILLLLISLVLYFQGRHKGASKA